MDTVSGMLLYDCSRTRYNFRKTAGLDVFMKLLSRAASHGSKYRERSRENPTSLTWWAMMLRSQL